MIGEIEMSTYEGVCKYCGDIQPIMAADQVDANEKYSEECTCGGGDVEKKRKACMKNLKELFGTGAEAKGFRQVDVDQMTLLEYMVNAVVDEVIGSATLSLYGSTAKIVRSGEKIKITREKKTKADMEA